MASGRTRSISTRVALCATLVLCIVGAAVTFVVYAPHQQILKQEQLEKLEAISEEQQQMVLDSIRRLTEDVQFLAGKPPIEAIAWARGPGSGRGADGDSEEVWRGRLEKIFMSFIKRRPEYFQVRLIGLDDGGKELVRVERAGANLFLTAKDGELQRKGDEPYMRAGRP